MMGKCKKSLTFQIFIVKKTEVPEWTLGTEDVKERKSKTEIYTILCEWFFFSASYEFTMYGESPCNTGLWKSQQNILYKKCLKLKSKYNYLKC